MFSLRLPLPLIFGTVKDAGLAAISGVKTLDRAKDAAKDEINAAVDALREADYSSDNWQAILDARDAALNAIIAATDIAGVDAAKDAGLDAINSVPTLLETGYDTPTIEEPPTATNGGTATVTHPDLPGETIDIDLPALDGENYEVTVGGDEVIYTYTD